MHWVVLEIAMATIGDAGSTVIIIAFSLESVPSRVCLVDRRGLLVRGVRASVHATLCPWRAIRFTFFTCYPILVFWAQLLALRFGRCS